MTATGTEVLFKAQVSQQSTALQTEELTPHVHDKNYAGGVRKPYLDEIP